MTTTARPPRNSAVRQSGQGRAGCRRRTLSVPQTYRPAATTTKPVTTGANCQRLTTSRKPNGGNVMPPRLPARHRAPPTAWAPHAIVTRLAPARDAGHLGPGLAVGALRFDPGRPGEREDRVD